VCDDLATYTAGSTQYPAGFLTTREPDVIESMLDTAMDQMVTRKSGRLLSRETIAHEDHLVREQRFEFAPGVTSPSGKPVEGLEVWRTYAVGGFHSYADSYLG
jgi:hypothetical protein